MNLAQRVVVVVALGIAALVAVVTVNLVLYEPLPGGWFDLAPNTGVTYTDSYFVVASDWLIVRQSLIGLLGLASWSLVSMWLLRTRTNRAEA